MRAWRFPWWTGNDWNLFMHSLMIKIRWLPSGKRLHNYISKIHHLFTGKLIISMAIYNSKLLKLPEARWSPEKKHKPIEIIHIRSTIDLVQEQGFTGTPQNGNSSIGKTSWYINIIYPWFPEHTHLRWPAGLFVSDSQPRPHLQLFVGVALHRLGVLQPGEFILHWSWDFPVRYVK